MTDQEIDELVENHVNFRGDWTDDKSAKIKDDILEWAKMIAHKFYEFGKQENDNQKQHFTTGEVLRYEPIRYNNNEEQGVFEGVLPNNNQS